MPTYTQSTRPLRIDTPLGEDKLLLVSLSGRESVSALFTFQLDLMAEDDAIDPKKLLGKGAAVTIQQQDGSERYLHGLVSRFAQLGRRDNLTDYRAEIVPWLWILSLSRDCRIFQDLSVLEIIEKVFKAQGFSDYEVECTKKYPKREYCVQYRESNLNFVSRLMEEEGIYYFFKHSKSKHTLVLADHNSTVEPYPGFPSARYGVHENVDEDIVTEIMREDALFVGKVTLRDYDPLQPMLTLNNTLSGDGVNEIYDYQPVLYTKLDEGDRYARLQLEVEEASRRILRGVSTCRFFGAGTRFKLEEHQRSDMNAEYTLLEVEHSGRTGDYRTFEDAPFDYTNTFQCIPHATPYRPPLRAVKPVMRGTQSALVVGKSGEEIWTDKYGRVKVQFHWDREGKKDEKSSCWVRVSSTWAGKQWGAISLPRIGQEVLVEFEEGDPNRPIIIGSVYNADQLPPYTLPGDQTQSGTKSRSSKGGGNADFNEIRFEDKKGSELLYVHAQKDKQVMVENDRTEEVGHDEKILIKNNRTEEVKKDETIKIGGNRKEEVAGNEEIKITGNRKEEVSGNEEIKIKGNWKENVTGNIEIDAVGNIKVNSKGKITMEAAAGIELKVAGSVVKITPASVEIKAPQIKVQGLAMVELKAPMMNGKADGMLQLSAPMTQLKGDGLLMVKGGVTMIN